MADTMDQEFVEYIVKGLVSKPDEVKVVRSIDEKGVLLELTVDPEDLGRVIGKRGNTAQSIRTLLRALGTKNDARYNLKIVDNGEPKPPREDKPKQDTPRDNDDSAQSADDESTDNSGASSWAHLSSSNDDNDDDSQADEAEEETTSSSSVVEKTKKELEDLDDLDI